MILASSVIVPSISLLSVPDSWAWCRHLQPAGYHLWGWARSPHSWEKNKWRREEDNAVQIRNHHHSLYCLFLQEDLCLFFSCLLNEILSKLSNFPTSSTTTLLHALLLVVVLGLRFLLWPSVALKLCMYADFLILIGWLVIDDRISYPVSVVQEVK